MIGQGFNRNGNRPGILRPKASQVKPNRPVTIINRPRKSPSRSNRYLAPRTGRRMLRLPIGDFFRKILKTGKMVFGGVFLLAFLVSLSLGVVVGYRYVMNTEYFMVRKVVLHGIKRIPREDVMAAAGLDQPSNILSLRLDKMGAKLKALPWIEDATLTRKLPDTMIIEIKERRPRTLISLGALYYLDHNGYPFKKVDPKENPELPIITGFTWDDFAKRRDYTKSDIEDVFGLLEILAERNDRFRLENISEINFDSARGLSLFTRSDNVQVKIGMGDYRAKLKRLGRVVAHLKINGQYEDVVYFNLECSPRVIVRHAVSG